MYAHATAVHEYLFHVVEAQWCVSNSLSLSLPLSLSLTPSLSLLSLPPSRSPRSLDPLALARSRFRSLALPLPLSLALSLSRARSLALALSVSLSLLLSRPPPLSLALPLPRPLTLSLLLSISLPAYYTHPPTPPFPHTPTHPHTHTGDMPIDAAQPIDFENTSKNGALLWLCWTRNHPSSLLCFHRFLIGQANTGAPNTNSDQAAPLGTPGQSTPSPSPDPPDRPKCLSSQRHCAQIVFLPGGPVKITSFHKDLGGRYEMVLNKVAECDRVLGLRHYLASDAVQDEHSGHRSSAWVF